jgi:hypothetical protein
MQRHVRSWRKLTLLVSNGMAGPKLSAFLRVLLSEGTRFAALGHSPMAIRAATVLGVLQNNCRQPAGRLSAERGGQLRVVPQFEFLDLSRDRCSALSASFHIASRAEASSPYLFYR